MPTYRVALPTLHVDQVRAYRRKEDDRGGEWAANAGGRFIAVRCGRRYGKTTFGQTWTCDGVARGEPVGWFAPDYKKLAEAWQEVRATLEPITTTASEMKGVIRAATGGRIDFWTLNDENAGRSRKYKRVFIDEAAFTNPNMMDIWKRSIKPTLLDYTGRAIVASNANGIRDDNFMWQVCEQPEHGFITHHAPSWANPDMPRREPGESAEAHAARVAQTYADLRRAEHPLVFRQEYEAEFVDWSGVAFFDIDKLLIDKAPVGYPRRCDAVFAIIDTATKTGAGNDGTAVIYYAFDQYAPAPLTILDWDYVQIEGALLETWLPVVLQNLEAFAGRCGARRGSLGALVEDKAAGEVLLQQAARRGLLARKIDSRLTALGKDERALSVSGYHYRGLCKISDAAHNKVVTFKKASRNHLVTQITGFRIGDKEAYKRADDLLDCYTYGLAVALGDSGGF